MQTRQHKLEISASMKNEPTDTHCRKWLEAMKESSALIGAILSIIHPDLYKAGIETLLKLREKEEEMKEYEMFMDLLWMWQSPFSGVSVISGRQSPIHRDVQAMHPWFDVLCTFGVYDDGVMELPSLGVRLEYNTGTMVALAGRVIPHGVARSAGKRVSLAYFMRQTVHERAGVEAGQWAT